MVLVAEIFPMHFFATVHFLKLPNLTPHPNPLPKGERE